MLSRVRILAAGAESLLSFQGEAVPLLHEEMRDLGDAYRILAASAKPFSLFIGKNIIEPGILQQMLPFIFLQGCEREGGQPVVYARKELLEDTRTQWQNILLEQGFNKIVWRDDLEFLMKEDDFTVDEIRLQETLLHETYLVARAAALPANWLSVLAKAEEDLERNQPSFMAAVRHLKEAKETASRLREEADRNKELVRILEINQENSDRESEARGIQDFYNREYESLPLWYKKFGHLIKIMTGKKSFKQKNGKA
jgi:hypothetical protein